MSKRTQVMVSKERKCFATLDRDGQSWILSFQQRSYEVEIEFTPFQLRKLREMINDLYKTENKFVIHYGQC